MAQQPRTADGSAAADAEGGAAAAWGDGSGGGGAWGGADDASALFAGAPGTGAGSWHSMMAAAPPPQQQQANGGGGGEPQPPGIAPVHAAAAPPPMAAAVAPPRAHTTTAAAPGPPPPVTTAAAPPPPRQNRRGGGVPTFVWVIVATLLAAALAVGVATATDAAMNDASRTASVFAQILWTAALLVGGAWLVRRGTRELRGIAARLAGATGAAVLGVGLVLVGLYVFVLFAENAAASRDKVNENSHLGAVRALGTSFNIVGTALATPLSYLVPARVSGALSVGLAAVFGGGGGGDGFAGTTTATAAAAAAEKRALALAVADEWITKSRPLADAMLNQGNAREDVFANLIKLYGDPPPAVGLADAATAAIEYAKHALFAAAEAGAPPDEKRDGGSSELAQDAARLLQTCVYGGSIYELYGDGDDGGGAAVAEPCSVDLSGEVLLWWRAPRPDASDDGGAAAAAADTDGAPPAPAEAFTDLLLCLAALRGDATVSRLRAGVDAELGDAETSITRCQDMRESLARVVGSTRVTPEHARAFVRGSGGGERVPPQLDAALGRWVSAATLVYAAAALRLRLCIVDYVAAQPAVSWITAPCSGSACTECGGGATHWDDIACVARLADGRWGVLSRDDATRTFSHEADLPFVLALVYAVTGRRA